ncbi:uncharacterized protein LOC125939771 isoform X2 [Dermacentor silvarum]|uniref:uncharacterized protein LOC125939771 isoform X2 n=1 Tax=Dermacentor silvarum TaxID=543639 RepID=UPI0021014A0A|nr:uncharacterized protein LOC125939771 isoform X2 [Dermacentor silvarum]
MNCSKPCKKRGRYKKFLHPGAKFEVPKSTVSRHRLASVAVCPAAENQAGTSRPDGETTRTADAIAPTQGYARIDALLLNENITQPDEHVPCDSSEASYDSMNAEELDQDVPCDSSEASGDSMVRSVHAHLVEVI